MHKGWHIQYNIVSRETLLEAKKHPDQYRDLVVRVAGYSAFFTALSPDAQDDIIADRTYAVISSARLRRRRAKSFTSSISSLLSFEMKIVPALHCDDTSTVSFSSQEHTYERKGIVNRHGR
ncbi:glycine radical domain-containing protein [Escherichia coli]